MLDSKKKTGKLLAVLRKRKNVTQKYLSSYLGVSSQAVSKWECGDSLPEATLLLDLSDFYDVSVDEILRGELITVAQSESFQLEGKLLTLIGFILLFVSYFSELLWSRYEPELAFLITHFCLTSGSFVLLVNAVFSQKKSVYNKKIQLIYSSAIVFYFIINIYINMWHITWTMFLIVYSIGNYVNDNKISS